ncbi:hypothetical protein JL722_4355 [Aureococcus anophagefferens]|nr:hypothetical protein JL722_4355 [Aureococcus anophagefferens]
MLRRLAATLLLAALPRGAPLSLREVAGAPLRLVGLGGREEPYLVEFYGIMCEQCDEMLGPMRRLEKKLGTKILKYEVWNDPAAYKLMQFLDKTPAGRSQCGGLPFFYNRKTGAVVCGATTEANLEDWAAGRKHAVVLTPPPSPDQIKVQGRATGAKARQQRVANEKKRKAVEDMRDRQLEPGAAAGLGSKLREPAAARRSPRRRPGGGRGAVTARARLSREPRLLRFGGGVRGRGSAAAGAAA